MTARGWWRRLIERRRVKHVDPFTAEEMAGFTAEVRSAREARS